MITVRDFDETDLTAFPNLEKELQLRGVNAVYGPAFTALDGERVIAIGGLVPMGGGTCEIWFHRVPDLNGSSRELFWLTRRTMHDQMRANGWRRVQARIVPTDTLAVRFIKAMGLTKESTMEAYWDGQDMDLYKRVLR